MVYAIKVQSIFDGKQLLEGHAAIIEDQRIVGVVPVRDLPHGIETHDIGGGILAPGFIDIQVNGGGGVMFNNAPCRKSLDVITAGHRPTGTTSMMPTMISDTRARQQAAVEAVREARAMGNAGVLGIHLEGPFFELAKRGTHKASMIRRLSADDIDWLSALGDLNVIVTLAPEHIQPAQIRQLVAAGLHVCAGHTNASYEQIKKAVVEGLRGFTHVFNAMSPLTGREPGTVGAALDCDNTWAGIIADGHHVHPANIRIAQKVKPAGKLLLVTDAMSSVGSEQSSFELYGERIEERDGAMINAEGALAGSAIGMIDAVRIAHSVVGLPLAETLRMAALYPATFLKLEHELGRIAKGYRADLVHFDKDFKVHSTWLAGAHQSHSGSLSC